MTKLDEAVRAAIIAGASDEERVVKAAIQAAVKVLVPGPMDIVSEAWSSDWNACRRVTLNNAGIE